MTEPRATTLHAPAKLTVELRVTGVRADGYHLIDAEMVSIDLADTLEFAIPDPSEPEVLPGDDPLEIVVDSTAAAGLAVLDSPDNLVRRALRAVDRRARVRLTKRIPAGGGLGGGSTDAAAVLYWAGRTGLHDVTLAASLGADVPFCVLGGRARVTGIGERLAALPFVERTFTLHTPPFGVSTPAVYRAWDDLGGPTGSGDNDLEAAALVVEPRLEAARDRLAAHSGQAPTLAGSGSTWFVEGAFPGPGMVVVRTVPGR
jgi:4-diphosphocytidyl-2-C-methyl-D-erythritol kinase